VLNASGTNETGVSRSEGESTVSDESDDTELSDGEIAAQMHRNTSLIQQYLEESYVQENEIQFAHGPLEGESITAVAPPVASLLHMPEEGDVAVGLPTEGEVAASDGRDETGAGPDEEELEVGRRRLALFALRGPAAGALVAAAGAGVAVVAALAGAALLVALLRALRAALTGRV
jgi:hypothetical protein